MNAAPNKFLIGFGVVMLIGCGGLGYMISQAAGRYSEAHTKYEQSAVSYNRLRGLPLYPDAANLKLLDDQKAVALDAAETLRQKLEPMAFALEAITPEQFQDKLRASVSALNQRSAEAGVKMPEKFYLGFDQYQSQPPKAEAAAPLWRQLKAIEMVVTTLIDNKVDVITTIQRTPLPEEAGGKASADLVSKFPFEVQFTADQGNFRKGLNEIVKNNKQFFITRSVVIKNANDKTTPKAVESATAPEASSKENQKEPALQYIVGTEKINVSLRLEMVVFANSFPK